jgi:long-chain acyl-CoA synthetase
LTLKIFELHLKYAADPEHTALKYNQLKVSYAELENQVEHYARYIVHLGLKPGDRVAIALPNCPEFIYSYLGITRAGGVAVPLNLLQSPRELAFMLKDAGTNFLITSEAIGRQLQQLPGLSLTPVILDKACREQISSASPAAFPAICPDTVCTFLYTSGTTGQPKAVMLTHANLVANVIAMDNVSDFDRDDNFLAVLPMFHSFGWATSVLLPPLPGLRYYYSGQVYAQRSSAGARGRKSNRVLRRSQHVLSDAQASAHPPLSPFEICFLRGRLHSPGAFKRI